MATSNTTCLLQQAFGNLNLGAPIQAANAGLLSEFMPFGNLPPELRIKIYKLGAIKGRVVQIEVDNGYVTGSHTPVPIIFHINREARYEAINIYRWLLPDGFTFPHLAGGSSSSPIYYHSETDTIYFHGKPSIQNIFFSEKRLPLFRNAYSRHELSYITNLRLRNVEITDDLLFWILLFPTQEKDKSLFHNIVRFTGVKKVEIFMARPTMDSILPAPAQVPAPAPAPASASAAGAAPTAAGTNRQQANLFCDLFKKWAPKVYDATDRPYIETMNHRGDLIGKFWDESYNLSETDEASQDVDGVPLRTCSF